MLTWTNSVVICCVVGLIAWWAVVSGLVGLFLATEPWPISLMINGRIMSAQKYSQVSWNPGVSIIVVYYYQLNYMVNILLTIYISYIIDEKRGLFPFDFTDVISLKKKKMLTQRYTFNNDNNPNSTYIGRLIGASWCLGFNCNYQECALNSHARIWWYSIILAGIVIQNICMWPRNNMLLYIIE